MEEDWKDFLGIGALTLVFGAVAYGVFASLVPGLSSHGIFIILTPIAYGIIALALVALAAFVLWRLFDSVKDKPLNVGNAIVLGVIAFGIAAYIW